MRESGLSGFLVLGADVIPGVDSDDGSFVIFVDNDGEAVVECELLERNIDLLRAHFCAAHDEHRQNEANLESHVSPSAKFSECSSKYRLENPVGPFARPPRQPANGVRECTSRGSDWELVGDKLAASRNLC